MAGRIMTRMTTDIDALSQLLQNGLVNALVNIVTFIGVGVALIFINAQLALVSALILPPLFIATIWFRSASTRAYETARERIAAVNANLQEGLSGVRVSQAFVREDKQPGGLHRHRLRLPRRARARPAARRGLLPVRRLPRRHRDLHRARRGQRARRARRAAGRLADRVPPVPQLVLRADPAALAGLRLVPAGAGRHRPHHRAARDRRPPCRNRPSPVLPGPLAGRGRARERALQVLHRDRRSAARRRPARRAGRDRRAGRRDRRRQEHGHEARLPLLRRHGRAGCASTACPVNDYDQVAFHQQLGVVPQEAFLFSGTIRDNIAYGRRGREPRRGRGRGARGRRPRLHRLAPGWLPAVGERARTLVVVRAAPADRARPGPIWWIPRSCSSTKRRRTSTSRPRRRCRPRWASPRRAARRS